MKKWKMCAICLPFCIFVLIFGILGRINGKSTLVLTPLLAIFTVSCYLVRYKKLNE